MRSGIFILPFPGERWCWTSCYGPYEPYINLLWWYLYFSLLPILKLDCLLSSCWAVWVVYTNWFRSFVGRVICRYFLPVRVLCLYLLTMSFEVQRFLILMMLNLSISYIVCVLGVVSKNVCAIWGHEITLLLSSKCSFRLYVKVYDPFALVFVYDIQFCIW